MPTEAAIPSVTNFGPSPTLRPSADTWRDQAWVAFISHLDTVLRRYHGVYEFTDDPECVLRVSFGENRAPVRLADGTRVEAGERIGIFHFWNEHLPRFSSRGPDLRWAKAMRGKVRRSLCALAEHVENDMAWHGIDAFRADSAFSSKLRTRQIERVVGRYGFELLTTELSAVHQLHAFGENFLLWGFARAFNPAALNRRHFLRERQELWISRRTLLALYGRQRDPGEARALSA
ncbi:MAG TPA: hypothetical protein VKY65_04515 [Alphaproteobacteria bacterium]|nr:hypothetical protein [Alphaproteobacteria bacterium]